MAVVDGGKSESRHVDASSGLCRTFSDPVRLRNALTDLLAVTSTDALNLLLWVNAPLTTCSEIGF